MDTLDRKILAELQADGRLTITDLAERVQLSVSPCHRRLRALEKAGVISAYRAHLDPAAVGLTFSSLVFVTLRDGDRSAVKAIESEIGQIREVVQAHRLFGDPDYLLQVFTRDLAAFQRLYDDRLSALPGVQRLSSTLVMKDLIRDRPLPL